MMELDAVAPVSKPDDGPARPAPATDTRARRTSDVVGPLSADGLARRSANGLARRAPESLARRAPSGLARHSTADGPRTVVSRNPAEVLALLMDFSGSVALAELLQAPTPPGTPHPQAAQLARKVHDDVRARLDAVLNFSLIPLTGSRAPKIPSASELFEALAQVTGEPGRVPDAEAAARLASQLGTPRRAALGASLRQIQAQFASLRWEIALELHAIGPHADRLERIDAALQRAIQVKLGELFARMEQAAQLTFERACTRACAALPANFTADDLAGWAAEGGWIARYRERCVQMAKAWFGHARRNLEGLLLAIEAEVA
jgi:hypothetical protein